VKTKGVIGMMRAGRWWMLGKCDASFCEKWTWNWQEYAFAVRALWKLVALRERSIWEMALKTSGADMAEAYPQQRYPTLHLHRTIQACLNQRTSHPGGSVTPPSLVDAAKYLAASQLPMCSDPWLTIPCSKCSSALRRWIVRAHYHLTPSRGMARRGEMVR
jgi:hypothetical protein